MTDGSPLRYAWLTIAALLLVGVVVTAGVAVFSTSDDPAAPTGPRDGEFDGEPPGVDGRNGSPGAPPPAGSPGRDRSPAEGLRVLHDRGITGENASVGVVDVTGFETSDPAIRDQVRAARSFGAAGGIHNGGRTGHGTAAASIVTRVAPDADLYLANFDSTDGFRRAVAWLLRQDVDVIVAPVSFYGQPDDGTAPVSRAATRASERGVAFVAPVGNLARGHWQGRYESVVDGRLQFDSSTPRDPDLEPPLGIRRGARNHVVGDARRFTLWLSWDRAHADEDYTAVLHRRNGSTTEVVARSEPYRGDDAPNERIVASLDPGHYFVTVRGPNRSTGATLELTSPTHRLGTGSTAGSVAAPATARRVVAVGAYDPATGRVARFSSRGPTEDGRPGVDLVAPGRFRSRNRTRLVGSSAAAPYVAGVAALIRSLDPAIPPARIEAALELTASDVGRPGYDYAAGHGVVAPARAVAYATGKAVARPANGSASGRDRSGRRDDGSIAPARRPRIPGAESIARRRSVKSGFDRGKFPYCSIRNP